ncbi:winged helix-turn-helix domain-containing protein [Deinococcus maricopensis]|uniref:Uncharacterized protein n=1 Tax=Deinococcus maricopensis (strain DSM 21211 / LMG 22137 / NRRL B-23946 / LB-34) TaxID=709986 RepID=E8U5K7_DEIML|nr:winged helix-turn-helix domain-containing protein [Deinococcus maricopensis]ADV66346.1 hypothetical protein Deima_0690 [Deinococcus maricopensis DSM 21211]
MTPPDSGSVTVRDEPTAHALLDPRTPRILGAFWDAPRSVSDAARHLGMPLDHLLYRVRRLETLGLLHAPTRQPRQGRPIKLYRTTASAYFVPFEVTRHDTLETYLAAAERDVIHLVQRNVTRALRAAGDHWGLRIARGPDGHIHTKLARQADQDWTMTDDGPALLSFVYPTLHLDDPDAKALQAELLSVFSRYAARTGARPYLCQMVLCPVTDPLS